MEYGNQTGRRGSGVGLSYPRRVDILGCINPRHMVNVLVCILEQIVLHTPVLIPPAPPVPPGAGWRGRHPPSPHGGRKGGVLGPVFCGHGGVVTGRVGGALGGAEAAAGGVTRFPETGRVRAS